WLVAALVKLFFMRSWSLFFLMLAAILLPFGGGIGTPIYGLFAIIVAVYATALGWTRGEETLSFFRGEHALATAVALAAALVMVRIGVTVPVLTKVASPLLAERERTYQLENVLAWLRQSDYCSYEVVFAEDSGSPIDSVESAISRRFRPPAGVLD